MKTELQAHISIDQRAWNRVRKLAASENRPLPVVIGDLLEKASAEPEADLPKIEEPYEPPPLVRLFLRRHPETQVPQD
jgi:hypothetical protein